jgi:uncharacterized membrane protein
MRRRSPRTMEERFLRPRSAVGPESGRVASYVRSRSGFVLRGIVRFVALVAVVAGLCVGVALLVVAFGGASAGRAIPVALYIGGAFLVAVAVLGARGTLTVDPRWNWDPVTADQLRRSQGIRTAYLAVGLAVVALGLLADAVLG